MSLKENRILTEETEACPPVKKIEKSDSKKNKYENCEIVCEKHRLYHVENHQKGYKWFRWFESSWAKLNGMNSLAVEHTTF